MCVCLTSPLPPSLSLSNLPLSTHTNRYYNVTSIVNNLNENLPMRYFVKNQMPPADFPYATTYDCPTLGGVDITVEGLNMGPTARIFIGGNECPQKSFAYVYACIYVCVHLSLCALRAN